MDKEQLKNIIFDHYHDKVARILGIDVKEAIKKYSNMGNTLGIEIDSMLMYYEIIKHFRTKNVLEFGSGFSTLIFAQITKILDGKLLSLEEEDKWMKITQKLLVEYGHNKKLVKKVYPSFVDFDFTTDFDFCFIDSSVALRQKLLRNKYFLKDIKVIIVDDFESMSKDCLEFMKITGRDNYYVYNGSGRRNRLQYINLLSNENISDFFFMHREITI